MKKPILVSLTLTAAVVTAAVGAVLGVWFHGMLFPPFQPELPDLPPAPMRGAKELQSEFASAIRRAMPAVVLITAKKRLGVVEWQDYRRHIDYREIPSGQGSGFLIRPDGYLVTNFHVVRDQDAFWVTASDGREYPAKVVGADPATDLAVLKIDGRKDFPTLRFADPESVQIGHWAIAIGAPFSLSQTVTVGIVSSKHRSGVGVNALENYIQTDASINPGNSGGPLLDIRGRVIGVNDFILSPNGGNIGLSFAISSGLAKDIAEKLIEKGYIERPWLGILAEGIDRETLRRAGLESGVLVRAVARRSPAADSLDPGDVIVKAQGRSLRSPRELQKIVMELGAGKELELEVRRGSRPLSGSLKLQVSPPNWFRSIESAKGALPVAL